MKPYQVTLTYDHYEFGLVTAKISIFANDAEHAITLARQIIGAQFTVTSVREIA